MTARRNSWVNPGPYYFWDWPGRPRQQLQGAVLATGVTEESPQSLKAVLYLPDPDSRSGWTLHHVVATADPKPQRKLGWR